MLNRRSLLFNKKLDILVKQNNWNCYTYRMHWLLSKNRFLVAPAYGSRHVGMLAARVVRSVLKLRYFLIGGTLAGGYTLQKSFDEFRGALPDLEWLNARLPDTTSIDAFRQRLIGYSGDFRDSLSSMKFDPRIGELYGERLTDFREWFARQIDDAFNSVQSSEHSSIVGLDEDVGEMITVSNVNDLLSASSEQKSFHDQNESHRKQVEQLQSELVAVQLKYQTELERLERDNKELRKRLLLKSNEPLSKRKIKKALIDLYSEVLDELSAYDSSYSTQDHLPRVVVVGDQSSGKTSVLEMIARARIFPRGGGEMMTRAPVKVTLSEGPYHVAQFRDSSREFNLSDEKELSDLRKEVEIRMRNSVSDGRTVSSDVISMSVKGPGLQRVVLVDLPGVISTETAGMAAHTRATIRAMSETYMANPNAIILCVQDGSVDAERSNVTDLVSKMDPFGKRTFFVLTKVDLAEKNLSDPDRLGRIMAGKLFAMRALGYFAVVTGRGNTEDSIETIKQYETQFFQSSPIFKRSGISSSQCTTANLSLAVSARFWKMVRESIEQQADSFRATKFNLETEWKNSYPRFRELDRDELFERVRAEILDEIANLSMVSAQYWEEHLSGHLWSRISGYVFESIYLPAAQTDDHDSFKTNVDIKLRHWAENLLPKKCVDIGRETLLEEFKRFMHGSERATGDDLNGPIFEPTRHAVVDTSLLDHEWESRAADHLRVIQLNTLDDQTITDKTQWDCAVKFMEECLCDKLVVTENMLKSLCGPGAWERWVHWATPTSKQQQARAIVSELNNILLSDHSHDSQLSSDELTAVRRNLKRHLSAEIDADHISDIWRQLYRRHFLRRTLSRVADCRRAFWLYTEGAADVLDETRRACDEIVFFWRIQQMLKCTANTLRQQIVNREARRLETRVKQVLEEWSLDEAKKASLVVGKRVELAEELKSVRRIQEKLEDFIVALQQEK